MNREQKAAVIEEITVEINESAAVFAVDYRGITVVQAAELRGKLRDVDATLRVVKNTLTERAADKAGAEGLKALLVGPTALTFVRGDAATAAKAVSDFARVTQLLPFKGGLHGRPGAGRRGRLGDRQAAVARHPQRAAREHRGGAADRPRDEPVEPHLGPRAPAGAGRREEGVRRDPRGRGARVGAAGGRGGAARPGGAGGRGRGRAEPEAAAEPEASRRPRPTPAEPAAAAEAEPAPAATTDTDEKE